MGIGSIRNHCLLNLSTEEENKLELPYVQRVNDELPQTIGGGIGQSRLCMFLEKSSYWGSSSFAWPEEEIERLQCLNIHLL